MYEVDIAPSSNTVRCMEGVCSNIIHIILYRAPPARRGGPEIDLDVPHCTMGDNVRIHKYIQS